MKFTLHAANSIRKCVHKVFAIRGAIKQTHFSIRHFSAKIRIKIIESFDDIAWRITRCAHFLNKIVNSSTDDCNKFRFFSVYAEKRHTHHVKDEMKKTWFDVVRSEVTVAFSTLRQRQRSLLSMYHVWRFDAATPNEIRRIQWRTANFAWWTNHSVVFQMNGNENDFFSSIFSDFISRLDNGHTFGYSFFRFINNIILASVQRIISCEIRQFERKIYLFVYLFFTFLFL